MKFRSLVSTACLSLALAAGAFQIANADTLRADAALKADENGGTISRYIYGQFSEHLGGGIYDGIWVGPDSKIPNVRGIRSDVVAALKDLHVPVVRWPGGCFADEYDWRDGIGPRDQRPVRKNNWWGDAPETNQFGTHEFMDFIDQIGSEAYLSVNVGSSSPKDMREWVEYMTSPGNDTLANERRKNGRDAPWKVAFWGIGNESWGCGGQMRPEYYADEYRRFQAFFHKSDTNRGLKIASGANAEHYEWTDTLMKMAGGEMDGISLHYYTLPTGDWNAKGAATGFSTDQWVSTFSRTLKMEEIISKHEAIMDKYDPQKRVGLFVDEWGTWYDVEKGTNPGFLYQKNTLRDAVLAAANFNIFHHHVDRVKMTSIAQTINVLQAMILTDKDKIELTPTYYAFKMYVPFQDATALPLTFTAPQYSAGGTTIPAFNASAARGKDGHVYIGIANMDPVDNIVLSVDVSGLKVTKVGGQVLTADKMDAANLPGVKAAVAPVDYTGGKIKGNQLTLDIPSKSVVVVQLN
ncbi:MAG: alpha-N-arabinofuranosidase [Asticcacaulis sp.]|nr:alpha-N-arabinofuranosidase [Asticcacaulis sp.]